MDLKGQIHPHELIIWDNQDDEFVGMNLALQVHSSGGAPATVWSRSVAVGELNPRADDFNKHHRLGSHVRDMVVFPAVRFLPDEAFVIKFSEADDTLTFGTDRMTATVPPLAAEEGGKRESDRIQAVSGDGGRYQIYGWKRHFRTRVAPTCLDP